MNENNLNNGQNQDNNNLQEQINSQNTVPNSNTSSSRKSSNKKTWIILVIVTLILIINIITYTIINKNNDSNKNKSDSDVEVDNEIKELNYTMSGNSLEDFDLSFLKIENSEKNKIYSPLSIKYALAMLEEGATGESKTQLSNVIGKYEAKKYINSNNMSFANAIFINNLYKKEIKEEYTNLLNQKYNAEVKFDSFASPNNVNSWISDKTLGLINNLFDDVSDEKLLLINALAIDMEWEEKFIYPESGIGVDYLHENFFWLDAFDVVANKFSKVSDDISGMSITASFNNYDIVKELGEDKIRETVKNEFLKYLKENPETSISNYVSTDTTGLDDNEIMEIYLDEYIKEINTNYKREDKTTDFSLYVDDNVKAFAKDLKEYNGTTLQYIGIMPTAKSLKDYVENVTSQDLNTIIGNLKGLKRENFKDGVITKIIGFIPKFNFEYNLDLMNDLKKLGINNVFELGKANLKNISDNSDLYINSALHKSKIEFTQDGIKAAAVTPDGGKGSGGGFDYLFDVPVEEIDLNFNKPYMFIIRDKNSGEVWFTGTVYNPLPFKEDKTALMHTIWSKLVGRNKRFNVK